MSKRTLDGSNPSKKQRIAPSSVELGPISNNSIDLSIVPGSISWSDLPRLCQERIFRQMTGRLPYRLVCRQWNELIRSVIQTLISDGDHFDKCMALFPQINRVILMEPSRPVDLSVYYQVSQLDIVHWIPSKDWLAHVPIKHITWVASVTNASQCLYHLFHDLSVNPNVTSLTLVDKNGSCNNCRPLYKEMKFLTSVELISMTNISLEQIQGLAQLPRLTELTLIDCRFRNSTFMKTQFVKIIQSFPQLKQLTLDRKLLSELNYLELLQIPGLTVIDYLPRPIEITEVISSESSLDVFDDSIDDFSLESSNDESYDQSHNSSDSQSSDSSWSELF